METKRFKLTTLAPVFIGSGKDIEPYEYYCDDGKVHWLSAEEFLKNADEATKKEYFRLLERLAKSKNNNISKSDQSSLKNLIIDRDNCKKISFDDPESLKPTSPIQLFQNNGKDFYIPGSSIKGAMRTLLLKYLINDIQQTARVKENIKNIENIENKVFRANDNDPLKDFWKCVQVSDTSSISSQDLYIVQAKRLNLEKLNRKENNVDRSIFQNLPCYQVAIRKNCELNLTISYDYDLAISLNSSICSFQSLDELLQVIKNQTERIIGSFLENLPSSLSFLHFPPEGDSSLYIGANTGFDRHTLWPELEELEELENLELSWVKREKINTLPKLLTTRDKDKYVPRCIVVTESFEKEYAHETSGLKEGLDFSNQSGSSINKKKIGDYHTFGWCRLDPLE